jgi:hypothetical protein
VSVVWTLAAGVLAVLAILVALLLLALVIPWHVMVRARGQPEPGILVDLRPAFAWMPRIARLAAPLGAGEAAGRQVTEAGGAPPAGRVSEPARRRASRRWPPRLRTLDLRRIGSALLRFLAEAARALRPVRLRLEGRIGTGDPAETGRLWGALCPLLYADLLPRNAVVALQPDFTGARFELMAEAELRILPLRVLWPAARLGWNLRGALR